MSDKKFDLNKFLQQPKLFTPIDYSGVVVPDLSGVQQTIDNFDEWRKSQGYKTNEEKLKEAQEKASAAMAELGNSEDVYDWYNAFQDDPRKQAEFRQQGAQGAGLLMTVPLTVVSAGTMGWIPALTSTATGFTGAYGGQKLGETIDAKYGTNITPWLALAGGLAGGYAGARNTPMMSRTMLHQAKNMNWTQEGVTIPTKAPKWKWARSKNAHYDNGTIKTPFFARKSQVAHELGHYVGDYGVANPRAMRGAFTPGYQYSPNAEMELNAAENFADYFKTKLGYPYTGKDVNLIERQNALQNETVFDDVVKPDVRVYESKLTEAERLGIPKGERNQPIFAEPTSEYGNIRFIRSLGEVPEVKNGVVQLVPEENNLINLTSDVPFRTHSGYANKYPHYIHMRPDAFKGHSPLSIDPSDTMFLNEGVSIHPDQVTFISGDVNALNLARSRGFRVKSTPELIKLFKPGESHMVGKIQLGKTSFGGNTHIGQYKQQIDDYFTKLGRPTLDDYHKLETKTGLSSHTVDIKNKALIDDKINKFLKAETKAEQDALINDGFLFKYPDGDGMLIKRVTPLSNFYKNVFYNPASSIEERLMLKIGYPQHPRGFNKVEFSDKVKHLLGAQLKNGGKINPQQ